ncbi:MAG: endonuclease/exonuclease/phosphatase family protein [Arenimonas sp.]|jgi:endonuclease/exonuclease/phosphatase family metal-dependent hydrolase
MKRLLLIILLLFAASSVQARGKTLNVMSFNIRCGFCEKPDDINHWSKRKDLVADLIRSHRPDLIGLQEAELFQVRDLAAILVDYDWVGVGRDDGKDKGEANAILFRKARFDLLTQETRWLSATPSQVGKGWDAAFNRTVSIVRLRDRKGAREFFLFNTHFDHLGQQARLQSSRLLVDLAKSLAGPLPLIVTGDFNYDNKSDAYRIVANQLRDAERASNSPAQGGSISFNGFGRSVEPGNKIDFIFVDEAFDVVSHEIITDLHRGRYPSDHYPLQARLRIR